MMFANTIVMIVWVQGWSNAVRAWSRVLLTN